MDFIVAGTAEGITSLQMDIKMTGITKDIMQIALDQAKERQTWLTRPGHTARCVNPKGQPPASLFRQYSRWRRPTAGASAAGLYDDQTQALGAGHGVDGVDRTQLVTGAFNIDA